MALSKDDIKNAYPLPVYNYKVEIGSDTVAFSEVSGLNVSYETTTYKESPIESGSPGPRLMNMPAQAPAATVTLKKASFVVPVLRPYTVGSALFRSTRLKRRTSSFACVMKTATL